MGYLAASLFIWLQTLLWEHTLPAQADMQLLPDGNLLIWTNRELYVLSAKDGQIIWRCGACQTFRSGWRLLDGYPLVEAGQIIPLSPNTPPDSVDRAYPSWRLEPYQVINALTGREIFSLRAQKEGFTWVIGRRFIPEQGILVIHSAGADNPKKFISSQTSILAAYDARTGALLWRQPAGKKPGSEYLLGELIAYGGDLYYLTQQALYAVEARTGTVRWRAPVVEGFTLRAITGTYLFIDEARDYVIGFTRGRLIAVRRKDGVAVWNRLPEIRRNNLVGAFSSEAGLLVFTDDVQPGSQEASTGRNLFFPPQALLIRYTDGGLAWPEPLQVPGLLVGYIPLSEDRLFCLFVRERSWRGLRNEPRDRWQTVVNILDIPQGRFLFRQALSLPGSLLHAASFAGGILVQTSARLQGLSESGDILWEKPIRRPAEVPFALREEGGIAQAFIVDETGQVYRWDAGASTPQPIGSPLRNLVQDPPQGLLYDNAQGLLWVWGGSAVYGLTPAGELKCQFERAVPAQPAAIRLLGAAAALGAYATSACLTQMSLALLGLEESSTSQRNTAISLRRNLQSAALGLGAFGTALLGDVLWEGIVKRRRAQADSLGPLLFLAGLKEDRLFLYTFDRSRCAPLMEVPLGRPALSAYDLYEVDPLERRVFAREGRTLRAYALSE
ncbi:MAG: PQQ-like beta-propeller repeat protein [Bacteroidia bacterium]|nr:PQQ-like beta-propeller repeat protein [Bacteroidia bacterium]